MSIKIKLQIAGQEVELTVAQLRELREELEKILGGLPATVNFTPRHFHPFPPSEHFLHQPTYPNNPITYTTQPNPTNMRTYTEEEEEAAEVVNFNYRRNVQTELPPGGQVKWTAGEKQLWLTAKDGRTVHLKGASVNVTDSALIITIPKDETARPPDVLDVQLG